MNRDILVWMFCKRVLSMEAACVPCGQGGIFTQDIINAGPEHVKTIAGTVIGIF